MAYRRWILVAGLLGAAVTLGGCGYNVDEAMQTYAEQDRSCSYSRDGVTITLRTAEGCARLGEAIASYERNQACSGLVPPQGNVAKEEYEDYTVAYERCVQHVQLGSGGAPQSPAQLDAQAQFILQAMRNTKDLQVAAIGAIPGVGQIAASAWQYKQQQETLQTAFRNSGMDIGQLSVTKSDDGGMEGGGGGGPQYVIVGPRNQVTPGVGSVANDGRNGTILAPGQNESVLDPSTVNNQNAAAPDNPINNAPVVGAEDNDGAGDFSLIPRL